MGFTRVQCFHPRFNFWIFSHLSSTHICHCRSNFLVSFTVSVPSWEYVIFLQIPVPRFCQDYNVWFFYTSIKQQLNVWPLLAECSVLLLVMQLVWWAEIHLTRHPFYGLVWLNESTELLCTGFSNIWCDIVHVDEEMNLDVLACTSFTWRIICKLFMKWSLKY